MQQPPVVPNCESGCQGSFRGLNPQQPKPANQILDASFYQQLDALYAAGNANAAEELLVRSLATAEAAESPADLATIYNELMGHYRTKGDFVRCADAMSGLRRQIRALKLKEGIEYATFMLNIANAERAMGKLDEAERDFLIVRDAYEGVLDGNDLRVASLYNNMGLLYRQKGRADIARTNFERALAIASALPGAAKAVAATSSNLADLLVGEGQLDDALAYARMAVSAYDDPNMPKGVDLSAALAATARIDFLCGNLEGAIEGYSRAADCLERAFGKTRAYRTICSNLAEVYRSAGMEEEAQRVLAQAVDTQG